MEEERRGKVFLREELPDPAEHLKGFTVPELCDGAAARECEGRFGVDL